MSAAEGQAEAIYANGRWICGAPARFGGSSATRKYTRSPLPVMWRCNRPVKVGGQRCWQHKEFGDSPQPFAGLNDD